MQRADHSWFSLLIVIGVRLCRKETSRALASRLRPRMSEQPTGGSGLANDLSPICISVHAVVYQETTACTYMMFCNATYLALIRPFADMLNRVCFGYDKERCLMFAPPDKVDRHWQSVVLTGALKNLTQ
jgi:hypothetical protein